MSGIAILGAVLIVLITNMGLSIALGNLPVEISGQLRLLFFFVTLFIGVLVYDGLSE